MGKFNDWGKAFDEGHPYCISYDQGKQILEYSSSDDRSEPDSEPDSEADSETTDMESEERTENTSDEPSNSDSSWMFSPNHFLIVIYK